MTDEEIDHDELHERVETLVMSVALAAFDGENECAAEVLVILLCDYLQDATTTRGHAEDIRDRINTAYLMGAEPRGTA